MGGSCPGPPPGGSGSGFFTFGAIVNADTINANKSDLNFIAALQNAKRIALALKICKHMTVNNCTDMSFIKTNLKLSTGLEGSLAHA